MIFTLRLRPAVPGDLPGPLTLYHQLSPHSLELEDGVACATFQTMLDDPGMQVLVAERGGLLGTVTLVIVPNLTQGARPYALIENVVTREDVRGQGVGTALMREAITRAQAQGVYKVMLIMGRTAPEVHRLYRGRAFRRTRPPTGCSPEVPRWKDKKPRLKRGLFWWRLGDSNPRPSACKADALPLS